MSWKGFIRKWAALLTLIGPVSLLNHQTLAAGDPAPHKADVVLIVLDTSFLRPELLQPDRVYEFTLNAGYTDNVFLKGHRIRIEISSSNFPHSSRNTNTGSQPEEDSNFISAQQSVYHNQLHASYLLLPLVPTPRKVNDHRPSRMVPHNRSIAPH